MVISVNICNAICQIGKLFKLTLQSASLAWIINLCFRADYLNVIIIKKTHPYGSLK